MKEQLLGNEFAHEGVSNVLPQSHIQKHITLLLMSALGTGRQGTTIRPIQDPTTTQAQDDLWEESVAPLSVDGNRQNDSNSYNAASRRHGTSEGADLGSSLPSNFDVIPSDDQGNYVADVAETSTWPCHLWGGFESETDFTGRHETFADIDACFFPSADQEQERLSEQSPELPCCCISGLGGMGKTSTAIQYALARQKEFDAIFVVQADLHAKLSDQFSKIAPALGLIEKVTDNNDTGSEDVDLIVNRSKALEWLASPKFATSALEERKRALDGTESRKLNWLLIFDNVEDSSMLRDYWPSGSIGCVLVTTRDARNSDYLALQSRTRHISLEGLDPTSASELCLKLSCIAPSVSNNADASSIVEKLGYLPLAIRQVAAYIFRKRMTLEDFLILYDKTLLDGKEGDRNGYSWSYDIITSWALDALSAHAQSLIGIYSYLDPDGVQDSLLTDSLENHRNRKLPANCPDDKSVHIDARGELLKSSLIRGNLSKKPLVIRMHRLVQTITVVRMAHLQRDEVFSFVACAIYDAWPFTENNWDHQVGLWSAQEMLVLHIFRLTDIAKAHGISGIEVEVKRKFIALLSACGW
jgi:hypothetical protein